MLWGYKYKKARIQEKEFINKSDGADRAEKIIIIFTLLLLLLRKGSYNGEFVAFKLSLPPYGAEKHIDVTEVNILFYIIFFIVYESAAVSERLKIFYKLIKNCWKRPIAIKRRYC